MADLESLLAEIIEFNQKRGWFPAPVDCAKSIVIEAAELLEHFQWDESRKIRRGKTPKKNWSEIRLELADILWYLVAFCHQADIDLGECLKNRIQYNEKKYPAAMFNGQHDEKVYYRQKRKYRQNRTKDKIPH